VDELGGVQRVTRGLVAYAGVVALCFGLTACGGGGSGPSANPSDKPFLPTDSPSASITMTDPPADYTSIAGAGFTISAPGEFQQQRLESSNGQPMLVLEKPSQVDAVPQRVAVIRDVDPQQSAAEQSFALETAKSAAGPAAQTERSEVSMPDEKGTAFLVTWKEARPSKGAADVDVTYWQLFDQVDKNLILNVVAFAPTAEFDTSEVSRILRTFVPDSSSSA
jgi:hypothetical protein